MPLPGLVAKSAIIDPAIADAAFALPSGEISQPVQGRFGTALVQVLKIEPELVRERRGEDGVRELFLLRAELDFPDSFGASTEMVFGGQQSDAAQAELTAVPATFVSTS